MDSRYYMGARDVLDLIEYFLAESKDLDEFKRKFLKIKAAVLERRIEELKEQLFLH